MSKKPRYPRIANFNVNGCIIRLGLDNHRGRDGKAAIAIIYQLGSNNCQYQKLNYRVTEEEYIRICKATGRGRTAATAEQRPFDIKTDIINSCTQAVERLKKMAGNRPLTKERLRALLGGKGATNECLSFTDLWVDVANSRSKPNTRDSYRGALNSFKRLVGDVDGFNITVEEVRAWDSAMQNQEPPLSSTTRGIYLRAMRVVWNEAQRRGLVGNDNYPFGKWADKVSIPGGRTRRKQYLSVPKMSELYRVFIERKYPDDLSVGEIKDVHEKLGCFLLQYLCNGCNLADLAQLRYDENFFHPAGEQLLFFRRQKTRDRDTFDDDICIPVITPLASVLEQVAAPARDGELVLPQLYRGATEAEAKKRRVAQCNKEIRECLHKLTASLGWTESPGNSWARHSFATNLKQAGAPEDYISECMGHTSKSAPITERYIDRYPIRDRMRYNSKLLALGPEAHTEELTDEELAVLKAFREKKNLERKKSNHKD